MAYKQDLNTFTFGTAIDLLKKGKLMARQGWNGKEMYLLLVRGASIEDAIHTNYGDINNSKPMPVLDAIYMKTADNKLVPWLASQTDMLSTDWVEVTYE